MLTLSRNILFYKKIGLPDTYETRIYLMFIHFSILMIITKKIGSKFDKKHMIIFSQHQVQFKRNGFGDVSVNKKMKELNKILYDILLKISKSSEGDNSFKINHSLVSKYFINLKDTKSSQFVNLVNILLNFTNFVMNILLIMC